MKNKPTKHQHTIPESFIKWANKDNKVWVLNLDKLNICQTYYGQKSFFAQDYFYEIYPEQFHELIDTNYNQIECINLLEDELNKIETKFMNSLHKLHNYEPISDDLQDIIVQFVATQYYRTPEQLKIFYDILKSNWKSDHKIDEDHFHMISRLEIIQNNFRNLPNTSLLFKTIYDMLNNCYIYICIKSTSND